MFKNENQSLKMKIKMFQSKRIPKSRCHHALWSRSLSLATNGIILIFYSNKADIIFT